MITELPVESKAKIVRLIGDLVFHREYFYDPEVDEAFYWKDPVAGIKVTTPFDDFVNQACEKRQT